MYCKGSISVGVIKQQILDEYNTNAATYQDAGVDLAELERYTSLIGTAC